MATGKRGDRPDAAAQEQSPVSEPPESPVVAPRPIVVSREAVLAAVRTWNKPFQGLVGERLGRVVQTAALYVLRDELQTIWDSSREVDEVCDLVHERIEELNRMIEEKGWS